MSKYTNRSTAEYEVKEVTPKGSILTREGTGFGVAPEYAKRLPVGTKFELETRSFSLITGIVLDGEWLFRKSDEDLEADHKKFVADLKAERKAKLDEHRADWQAREDALPEWIRARLINFHKTGGEKFETDGWFYELGVAELADLINDTMPNLGEADSKQVSKYCREQGVSGNQYGIAKLLVRVHREAPADIITVPSALTPITGDPFYDKEGK